MSSTATPRWQGNRLEADGRSAREVEGRGRLSRAGPRERRPHYHFNDRHARSWSRSKVALEGPEAPSTPREVVARTFAAFNCYACHQRDGIGGVEEARNAFFQTTQKEMGDEGRIPPRSMASARKLTADYLRSVLQNGARTGPYLLTRMPRFGAGGLMHWPSR